MLFKKNRYLPLSFTKIKKIFVIRTDGLGDIVMSTPIFKALRDIFPYSHITLLSASWSKYLVEAMPTFDEIIYFDVPWIVKGNKILFKGLYQTIIKLRNKNIDLAIDLRGDFRNNILMILCGAKYRVGFGITGCDFLLTHIATCYENHHPANMGQSLIDYINPENKEKYKMSLWVTEEAKKFVVEFLNQNRINYSSNDNLIVIIHPAARWYGREWTIEGYAEIADKLIKEYNAKVIFTGSPDEIELTESIANLMKYKPIIATGKTSLQQLLALLERSNLFIGVDSGPMHMATAMGNKVIALFGAARPEAVGPYGDGHIVVTKQNEFPCSPCAQSVCKRSNDNCMKAITVEEVWNAIEKQVK